MKKNQVEEDASVKSTLGWKKVTNFLGPRGGPFLTPLGGPFQPGVRKIGRTAGDDHARAAQPGLLPGLKKNLNLPCSLPGRVPEVHSLAREKGKADTQPLAGWKSGQ